MAKVHYGEGYPAVGLNSNYMKEGINYVTILAKDKDGTLKHPGLYTIKSDLIKQYPAKSYPGVPKQYFVPIDALTKVNTNTFTTDFGY